MGIIKTLVVHHSATRFGNAILINGWHTTPKSNGGHGFRMIGYHWVILNGLITADQKVRFSFQNGAIETGRPVNEDLLMDEDEIGAHAYGHNIDTLSACLIGKDKFTPDQFISLKEIYLWWQSVGANLKVLGHSEASPPGHTICPEIDMDLLRNFLTLPFTKSLRFLMSEMKQFIIN